MNGFSFSLVSYPSGFTQMLIALDFALGPSREIVITGNEKETGVLELVHEMYLHFLPNKVVVLHPDSGDRTKKIEMLAPFLKAQRSIDGLATAYVCRNYICDLPTTDPAKFKTLLEG